MNCRLLLTSDLHQHTPKWHDLVSVAARERADFVLVAGDLLPKTGGFKSQKEFFQQLRKYFTAIKAGSCQVLTYLGNDDFHVLEPLLNELESEGLCINMNGRVFRSSGLVFCGMNKVRDYPFGYKHYCARDGEQVACPVQFCGQGLTVDEKGNWVQLKNLEQYLKSKPGIEEELAAVKRQLADGEMSHSIWLIHQPPAGLGFDICADGRTVGSDSVYDFISANQPLLGVSGHIHESPYEPGGRWINHVGRTLWVQAGQETSKLHYVALDITPRFNIRNITHSIFGRTKD